MVFPPASCLQSGSVVALCYLAFLGLVSHWRYPGKAACGEGMILEKMFDEVKDIFSCQCVALTVAPVSITGEESNHYGERRR